MKILDTKIPEVKIIEPDVFGDHRGWFMETWSLPKYEALHFNSMQDNESFTAKRGTLRGIHFQQDPMAQAKIVRVVRGAVLDVAVDLREGSATYGKWYGVELSEENKKQFLIPEGFAHGFLVLSDEAEFCYKVNDFWHPNDEGGLAWNDPAIGIQWPDVTGEYHGTPSAEGYCMTDGTPLTLSEKDQEWPGLEKK